MIPIVLGSPPKEIPKSEVVAREEFKYSVSMSQSDSDGVKVAKNPENAHIEDYFNQPTAYIGIRRHLRSNKYSLIISFNSLSDEYDFAYARINGKLYRENELRYLKDSSNVYEIHPDSGLEGWSSDLKDLSSVVLVGTNNVTQSKTLRFSFNLRSHKSVENKKVNISDKPIDLESVNNSNFAFSYNPKTKKFSETHWNMYNHLILEPLPMKKRVVDDIYKMYSYNELVQPWKYNPNPESVIKNFTFQLAQIFFSTNSEDISIDRDFDFHGGKIKGLISNKKTEMETFISDNRVNKYSLGKMSIKNYSYYDFKLKKTIIEPNEKATQGYVYPLNKKGNLSTHVSFSPNAAYKNLEVYRQYKIENKVLDMYEGLVSLKITNPKKTSEPVKKTMIFNSDSFKKIILNNLSLKSLERISDES